LAYETEIIELNNALIGTVAGKQTTGGGVLSFADYSANIAGLGGTKNNDPLLSTIIPLLTPPAAPTTSSASENLSPASGLGTMTYFVSPAGKTTTTATDYVSQWVAYFLNVENINVVNRPGTKKPLFALIGSSWFTGQPTLFGSGTNSLLNIAGEDSRL